MAGDAPLIWDNFHEELCRPLTFLKRLPVPCHSVVFRSYQSHWLSPAKNKMWIGTGMTTCCRRSYRCWLSCWLILSASLTTASDEVDCRAARSGYVSGDPIPDTCTVQLTLNDAETEMIDSLRAECQNFPLKCRPRKYIIAYTVDETRAPVGFVMGRVRFGFSSCPLWSDQPFYTKQ